MDSVKQAYSNMPRIYNEAASKEMKDLPADIEQATVEFLPQLGHCLCIRWWLPPHTAITPETAAIPHLEMKVISFFFFFF